MNRELKKALDDIREAPTYVNYSALNNLLTSNDYSELDTLNIAILRNFTVEPLLPVIAGELGISGFSSNIYLGDFDTIAVDVFDDQSKLYQHEPDFIIISQWLESISPYLTKSFLTQSDQQIDEEIDRIVQTTSAIFRSIRKNSLAPILINNFPLPEVRTLGILDAATQERLGISISFPDNAGESFDPKTIKEISDSIKCFQRDIRNAEKNNNLNRKAELEEEYLFLTRYLARGIDINGQIRLDGDPLERSRKAVCKDVKMSKSKIKKSIPALWFFFDNSIKYKTYYFSYTPSESIRWQIIF